MHFLKNFLSKYKSLDWSAWQMRKVYGLFFLMENQNYISPPAHNIQRSRKNVKFNDLLWLYTAEHGGGDMGVHEFLSVTTKTAIPSLSLRRVIPHCTYYYYYYCYCQKKKKKSVCYSYEWLCSYI